MYYYHSEVCTPSYLYVIWLLQLDPLIYFLEFSSQW